MTAADVAEMISWLIFWLRLKMSFLEAGRSELHFTEQPAFIACQLSTGQTFRQRARGDK